MSSTPAPNPPRVCVVQDGARLHYAIPIALQRAGALERVYTDWYAGRPIERAVTRLLGLIRGGAARRMAERAASELDAALVRSKPSLALQQIGRRKRYPNELEFFAMLR